MKKYLIVLLIFLSGLLFASQTIKVADVGWDSVKLNNAIIKIVGEKSFGYTVNEVPGSTPIIHEALKNGEVDVVLEEWTSNIPSYVPDLEKGLFVELGLNFDDNYQGFYIPKYTKEKYPELKTVQDLKGKSSLFGSKIYGGIPGWEITSIMEKKVKVNNLDKEFEYIIPGSNAAMDTTVISALDDKKDIVFYYWEPTYLMGIHDFVLLEDIPYDAALYQEGIGQLPSVPVTIAVSNQFFEENKEFCEFLSKYHISSKEISTLLYYMQESELTFEQTASYYIENNKEAFTSYLGEEKAKLLYQEGSGNTKAELFPFTLSIKTSNIDKAVRSFATNSKAVLSGIQNTLNGFVVGAYNLFKFIPWYVFLALVFFLSFLGKRKLLTAFFLTSLIFVVGLLGLYEEMLLTLSIALTSVIISLVLGLPLGILIANSSTANKIVQPILDTMQTMPVFVYLIPALLLFGMGNAASVIATVIYAIVPIVRLTSLGIRNVDKEIIESGKAFGSTSWQILTKIQIPQALPTIATGINQTLMMAMAMVVTCSMIGARGLGLEVLNSVNRIEIGNGLVAGTCVVILAIVLDRITMGYVKKDKIKND